MGEANDRAVVDEAPEFRATRERTEEEDRELAYKELHRILAQEAQDYWMGVDLTSEEPEGWAEVDLEEVTNLRTELLREAETIINGDRNNHYGPPDQDFTRTAGVLNALGYRAPDGGPLEAHDVAILQMAVKLSRLMWSPGQRDHWVDLAGYSACGHEAFELNRDRG